MFLYLDHLIFSLLHTKHIEIQYVLGLFLQMLWFHFTIFFKIGAILVDFDGFFLVFDRLFLVFDSLSQITLLAEML